MQKQTSDKYQLREILFVHNNAIAMKPALLKKTNKQTNKKTFSINENYKTFRQS